MQRFLCYFFAVGMSTASFAGQQLNAPVSVSNSGTFSSASGNLSDTHNEPSTTSYFYCAINSGAAVCIARDAENDNFGCFLLSSSSSYETFRQMILAINPSDMLYINADDGVCTSLQVRKDSRFAG